MDEELIQKAKKGDKEAYRELFDKYSGKVLSYLYRYMGDYQKAEDAMIETFLDVYKRLPMYEESGKFLPWVFTIATNYAKKEFRKKRKGELSMETPIGDDDATLGDMVADDSQRPDRTLMADELKAILENVIAKLDEKYRGVLILCDVEGLSYDEAARALGCDKVTVGVRLSRARKLLYEFLKKRGYGFEG
jgi:RNA polymerase sigma-70 factor, ECF subfamily